MLVRVKFLQMPQFHFKALGITVITGIAVMTVMARVIKMTRETDNKNDQDKMTGTTGMTLRITWNTRMTGMTRMTWMTRDDWCELVGQNDWDDCDKRDVVAEVGHNQAKINVGCFCQCKTIFYTRQQLAGVINDNQFMIFTTSCHVLVLVFSF